MIILTDREVNEALKKAHAEQDKIIQKAKEKNGPKTSRTSYLKDERADETI